MKLSAIRTIKSFCDDLFSTPDWREVVASIDADEDDFEVGGVRFIAEDAIDDIQAKEMESDEYLLGCFNANFLSGVIGIGTDVIEAMQKAEAFEAVGKLIISLGKLEELQQKYASADGYGHHFNSYDGNEVQVNLNGKCFCVFDNHRERAGIIKLIGQIESPHGAVYDFYQEAVDGIVRFNLVQHGSKAPDRCAYCDIGGLFRANGISTY